MKYYRIILASVISLVYAEFEPSFGGSLHFDGDDQECSNDAHAFQVYKNAASAELSSAANFACKDGNMWTVDQDSPDDIADRLQNGQEYAVFELTTSKTCEEETTYKAFGLIVGECKPINKERSYKVEKEEEGYSLEWFSDTECTTPLESGDSFPIAGAYTVEECRFEAENSMYGIKLTVMKVDEEGAREPELKEIVNFIDKVSITTTTNFPDEECGETDFVMQTKSMYMDGCHGREEPTACTKTWEESNEDTDVGSKLKVELVDAPEAEGDKQKDSKSHSYNVKCESHDFGSAEEYLEMMDIAVPLGSSKVKLFNYFGDGCNDFLMTYVTVADISSYDNGEACITTGASESIQIKVNGEELENTWFGQADCEGTPTYHYNGQNNTCGLDQDSNSFKIVLI